MQDQKIEEFKALVKPLQEYIEQNYGPYTTIIVNQYASEMFEGIIGFTNYKEFNNVEYNHQEGE